MSTFSGLQPAIIWKYFEEILQIPRPSEEESQIREYLVDFARSHQLEYEVDATGNLLIRKGASQGKEMHKGVILQSHLDMVGEKNADTKHDFSKDPITAYVDDTWIKARGTTLGADDGIGIAAQMALLASDDIQHGPIECLFTVAEETGLTGAFGLESGFLKHQILLNLDSEDEGELFIGCAGGVDVTAWFDYNRDAVPEGHTAVHLVVKGLNGGHSGDEIHKGLGNSNKILGRFLWMHGDALDIRLHEFSGGNLRNAIPREAFAVITLPKDNLENLQEVFKQFTRINQEELVKTEPKLEMLIEEVTLPEWVIDENTQYNLLNAIYACPHGVLAWSQLMPDMVETSTNLAAVKFEDNRIKITTSQRSSLESAKDNMANMVETVFTMAGADTERSGGYPGWNPNPDSEIVGITAGAYNDLFHNEPIVRAIHAGLECGLFLEKYPELDMVSFGPTIKGAHSPDERLDIETTEKFWLLLCEVLKRIPKNN